MKKVLRLQGLDCPVCAKELEEEIGRIDGVRSVSVAFAAQKLTVDYKEESTLQKVVYTANHFEEVQVIDGGRVALKEKKTWKGLLPIALSAILFGLGVLAEALGGNALKILSYVLYATAYCSVGYPVLIATGKNIVKGRIFDENFLMTVASLGSIFLGEIHESVLVMLLYQLGEFLQGVAVGASRRSVAELMNLKSESATRIRADGEYENISTERISVGDVLLVRVGEKFPVDGVLLDGDTEIDCKALTGESELRSVYTKEEILSGCINVGKAVRISALRQYSDSAVGKILDLVENATDKKAAPEKFITKFARVYTPVVCLLALAVFGLAPLISYLSIGEAQVERFAKTALTFLVVSCPCALVISVPLTYFSGIGVCAKNGILVKGATYLDALASVEAMAFDKTGTLTEGVFSVRQILPLKDVSKEEILKLAASLERYSSHPIAKAFSDFSYVEAKEVIEATGKGLRGFIEGSCVLVGRIEFLRENGVEYLPPTCDGTLVCVAKDGKPLGCIVVGDGIRREVKNVLSTLEKLGIKRLCMLTGDREQRARKIANEIGMVEEVGS